MSYKKEENNADLPVLFTFTESPGNLRKHSGIKCLKTVPIQPELYKMRLPHG